MPNNKPKKATKQKQSKPNNKPRRNRRKGMRVMESQYNKARDPGMIIKQLAKVNLNDKMPRDEYLCCRMGMRPTIPPSIPDGGSGKHIAVCLYSFDTITAGAGATGRPYNFILQTTPFLPLFASVVSQSTITPVADYLRVNGVQVSSGVKYGIGRPNNYFTNNGSESWPGAIGDLTEKYGATSMRIVSLRHKIVYTGPAVACSGSVLVYANKASIQPIGETNNEVLGTGRVGTVYFPDGTGASPTRSGTELFSAAGLIPPTTQVTSGQPLAVPTNTQLYRPEQSITLIPKHTTEKYMQVPVRRTPILITAPANETGTNINYYHYVSTSTTGSGWGGGINAFDDDWQCVTAVFNGVNSDASFTVETCACVEFTPRGDSSFYSLSKEPVTNIKSFKRGHRVSAELPPSVPTYGRNE